MDTTIPAFLFSYIMLEFVQVVVQGWGFTIDLVCTIGFGCAGLGGG